MIQAADIKPCHWDREFDDRSGPHVTGYRCREHPRATMLHTRSGRVSSLVHYVDGVRCAGGLVGVAEALNRPHDRAGAPARLAALLSRITREAAVVSGWDGGLLVSHIGAGRTRLPMVHFEGLAVAWVAAPASIEGE